MRTAAWVLPSCMENSGGFRTIFQNVQCLMRHGYQCDIYAGEYGQASGLEELERLARKYFGVSGCGFIPGYAWIRHYDIIFATSWETAGIVRDGSDTSKKAYFIQDYEALFYPAGTKYLEACHTYSMGLYPVTIGKWLAAKMIHEYHAKAQYFDFCADQRIYKNLRQKRERAVCFIYQPDKPRRCSSLGIRALGIVKYLRPDVNIYLYGSARSTKVPFVHKNLKVLSVEQCNRLYNRCSVGLCISASNPSRIPFEMMAAGLPVVDLHLENNLYDMPQQGVLLAHHTPEAVAQAVIDLLDHPQKARLVSEAGQAYMKGKDLGRESAQFYEAVEHIIADTVPTDRTINKSYTQAPVYGDRLKEQIPQDVWKRYTGMEQGRPVMKKLQRLLAKSSLIKSVYRQLRGY